MSGVRACLTSSSWLKRSPNSCIAFCSLPIFFRTWAKGGVITGSPTPKGVVTTERTLPESTGKDTRGDN